MIKIEIILLIAYQVSETEILFYMIDTHENFYRKLKNI